MRRILFALWLCLFCFLARAENEIPERQYADAERAFLKNDYQESLDRLNALLGRGGQQVSNKMLARAHNLKGLIYFQLKNINAAVEEFDQAVAIAKDNFLPDDPSLHLARYNLANAIFQAGRFEEANEKLGAVSSELLDIETRTRFFHLRGNVWGSLNKPLEALESYVKAAHLAREPVASAAYLQKAFNASKNLFQNDPQEALFKLELITEEVKTSLSATLAIRLIMARGKMYLGRQEEALEEVESFLQEAKSDHPLQLQAIEMRQQISRLSRVDPKAIGILLPLTGKFAKFGRLCLNSILMAAGSFEDMRVTPGASDLRFVIKDSGESAESATTAFDELVFENNVIAVIGPLLSKQGAPIAAKAQEYGVPLFSLSQRNEKSQLGSFVFPIALSPAQQVDIITRHAIVERRLRSFAILAPSDSFGDEYVKLFWDAVEAQDRKIVAIERYEPKSTDFREELQSMLGLQELGARQMELDELNRRETAYAATLKVKGLMRKRLLKMFEPRPMVKFDAVFIPDDPQIVGQIAPAFAVYELDKTIFLGLNTWNNSEIIQRAGRYVQNSIFVDAFFSQSEDPLVREFTQEYRQFFSLNPGTLEVQSYDAARILVGAFLNKEPGTRADLKQSVLDTGVYKGASGEFRFSAQGLERSAYLLTVKGNSIQEIVNQNAP